MNPTTADVCIIGGSYAGLSAALALGRSLRNVLIIDSGTPCNRFTPHSHNFLTQDGETPAVIAARAKEQVLRYPTVSFGEGRVVHAKQGASGFDLELEGGSSVQARKLLFATGLQDELPHIPGFADCWGVSILHCPYCHGYEVRHQKTGILAKGDTALEMSKLIRNWTADLTLFTNGEPRFSPEQSAWLEKNGVPVLSAPLKTIVHREGMIRAVQLEDGTSFPLTALYARLPFRQQCDLPSKLGCTFTETGLIGVDSFGRTSIPGVSAAGDNCTPGRALSLTVASGTMAGIHLNKTLIEEEWA